MASPISTFLRDLRLQAGMTQRQLAVLLGYEQGYVSSVELGLKSPSNEFLTAVLVKLHLSAECQVALANALKCSKRRFTLPPGSSAATFLFCNDLWQKIECVHPDMLTTIHNLIRMNDLITQRPLSRPEGSNRTTNGEIIM